MSNGRVLGGADLAWDSVGKEGREPARVPPHPSCCAEFCCERNAQKRNSNIK